MSQSGWHLSLCIFEPTVNVFPIGFGEKVEEIKLKQF